MANYLHCYILVLRAHRSNVDLDYIEYLMSLK